MTKLTESAIEDFAIKLFERLGVYASDTTLSGQNSGHTLVSVEARMAV